MAANGFPLHPRSGCRLRPIHNSPRCLNMNVADQYGALGALGLTGGSDRLTRVAVTRITRYRRLRYWRLDLIGSSARCGARAGSPLVPGVLMRFNQGRVWGWRECRSGQYICREEIQLNDLVVTTRSDSRRACDVHLQEEPRDCWGRACPLLPSFNKLVPRR